MKTIQKITLFVFFNTLVFFTFALNYEDLVKLTKEATKQNYVETEKKFSKIIKKNKNDANVFFERHLFYYKFFKDDLALQDISKAIELNPDKYIFYDYRANLFLELDSLNEAQRDISTMYKMYATIPNTHIYKGQYLLKIDSLQLALNSFDTAVFIHENKKIPCSIMSRCYSARGRLNYAFGNIDIAINDFTKAIARSRDNRKDNLYMLRANAYLAKADIKNGYQDIGTAFASKPDTMTLAYLYALNGSQEKLDSIVLFITNKKSKNLYREGVKLYNFACHYAIINQKEKALEYLERSLQSGYKNFNWIKTDFDMRNIKNLPEFNQLIQKYQTAKQ